MRYCQFYSPVITPITPIFDHNHPKKLISFYVLWIGINMQENLCITSIHTSDTVNFTVLWPDWLYPVNLYQYAKNQFISSIHSSDIVNFTVPWPDWPHPFFTMPTQKKFGQFFIIRNLYQHAKNQFIPPNHYSDIVNFRAQWPGWSQPFLTMPTKLFLINFWFMWICINMQKIRLFHWFILKIWLIKKSCNLTHWEHFEP